MKLKFNVTPVFGDRIPLVDVIITNPQNQLKMSYPAMVDSGAFMCVFHSEVADALEIDLAKIKEVVPFGGVGKAKRTLKGKPYIVKLMVMQKGKNHTFESLVLFSEDIDPDGYPLLGRQGFFDQFREISFDLANNKFYFLFDL
jgi:hypothetical protein